MTHADQHTYLLCRAFDTEPRARPRAGLLAERPQAVLDALALAGQVAGATKVYLCVSADDEAQPAVIARTAARGTLAPAAAASADEMDLEVVRVTPSLVLEDDSALLRLLEGRQAMPYVRVPASAALTLRDLPATVVNLEALVPSGPMAPLAWESRWPSEVLDGVSAGTCGVQVIGAAMRYLSGEACGGCLACSEGTRQAADLLADIVKGEAGPESLQLLQELARALAEGSICGLGRGAARLLQGGLHLFAGDFRCHVEEHRCAEGRTERCAEGRGDG